VVEIAKQLMVNKKGPVKRNGLAKKISRHGDFRFWLLEPFHITKTWTKEETSVATAALRHSHALRMRLIRRWLNGSRTLYVGTSGAPPIFEGVERLASRQNLFQDNTKEVQDAIANHHESKGFTFILVDAETLYINCVVPALE
jgi:hypothetical protein